MIIARALKKSRDQYFQYFNRFNSNCRPTILALFFCELLNVVIEAFSPSPSAFFSILISLMQENISSAHKMILPLPCGTTLNAEYTSRLWSLTQATPQSPVFRRNPRRVLL